MVNVSKMINRRGLPLDTTPYLNNSFDRQHPSSTCVRDINNDVHIYGNVRKRISAWIWLYKEI